MSTPFHTKVHVHSIKNEMSNRTMAFANPGGLTKAQLEGRLVEPDPAVPCGMKLVEAGTAIGPRVARIDVFENRGPGAGGVITAQFQFTDLVPILDGDPLAQGDTAVGGGDGFVKKGGADDVGAFVAEVLTVKGVKYASVVKL
ncbi:hypothetical protein ASG32_07990 [Methylobacterium sp. Leaf361]|uniref:hypothetical protein n=1 Tax=Methylobacterium sp. Leaf361 TaxID=1736352 RepID=UPI0006F9C1D1|nr:hypothetical protein [Methylobacterium sp. Leaf361]KQS75027.1 hypothetical protein ASG32_07990 [Methylobacterium sp. Leaf361]